MAKRLFPVLNSPLVTKKLTGVGKDNVTRKRPKLNSADFMATDKVHVVFHVFGCFKFKVTFHPGFSLFMSSRLNGF